MIPDLYRRSLDVLQCGDADAKLAATGILRADWQAGRIVRQADREAQALPAPGRPALPRLVPPREVPKHSIRTQKGHAALLHALAHIEFNAINLALDAVYRFRDMPHDFYSDWLQVAAEEALHFGLLRDHLRTLGYDYGAFDAHDGLWQMAVKTAHDPLARMALVPRLLEARGLDASPAIAEKLRRRGDLRGGEILDIILRDEISHVRIGNRWYEHLCAERGLEPAEAFQKLLAEYDAPRPRPPLNSEARRAAGFSEEELRYLETGGGG